MRNLQKIYEQQQSNPVILPGMSRSITPEAMNREKVLDEMIEDYLIPVANFDSIAKWFGVVLLTETYSSKPFISVDTIPRTSWAFGLDYSNQDVTGYRVHIRELHSHIPLPNIDKILSNKQTSQDVERSKMHPLFFPAPKDNWLPRANVDDLVLVEINNPENSSYAVYKFLEIIDRSTKLGAVGLVVEHIKPLKNLFVR